MLEMTEGTWDDVDRGLANAERDGVMPGGAIGARLMHFGGLSLALSVGGADLDDVIAGRCVELI